METVKIQDWKLVENSDEAYTVQKVGFRLRGRIFGHPEAADGSVATTSEIISIDGLKVLCASRIYELSTPSNEFMTQLSAHGYDYNEANPLGPYMRWLVPTS